MDLFCGVTGFGVVGIVQGQDLVYQLGLGLELLGVGELGLFPLQGSYGKVLLGGLRHHGPRGNVSSHGTVALGDILQPVPRVSNGL